MGTTSSIRSGDPNTWGGKTFVTFDLDWACDSVLADTIDLVEDADVAATWFVTHDTSLLARLRANPKFELGVHPNFNWLLQGDSRNGANAREVLQRLMTLVPEAKSVRSHSMTQSSQLLQLFAEAGLTHDVNHFIPASLGVDFAPWTLWNGMTRVPYFWEDDVYCICQAAGIPEPTAGSAAVHGGRGLKVFDIHPIHVFLNTEHLDRYERTRSLHQNPTELIKHRYEGYGTRNRLMELLALARKDAEVATTAKST